MIVKIENPGKRYNKFHNITTKTNARLDRGREKEVEQ